MSVISANGGARHADQFKSIRFKDHEISWAGQNPFAPSGFCFGTEESWLLFTDEEGKESPDGFEVNTSQEAINGVACTDSWLAVSTRDTVTFVDIRHPRPEMTSCLLFPLGAHGITATACGSFLAPLGRSGIMALKPPLDRNTRLNAINGEKEGLNFYRVVSLHSEVGREIIASAARLGGVGAIDLQWDGNPKIFSTQTFSGLDVVDICPLELNSLGIGALGRDGTLVLMRDALHERKALSLKFENIEGTAYRLLRCNGDVFIVTSKAIYMLASLAARFLRGELIEKTMTPILVIPVEAVDAALCFDKWLLVVTPDDVRRYDVALMHASTSHPSRNGEIKEMQPRTLSPTWEHSEIVQASRQLAEVAG